MWHILVAACLIIGCGARAGIGGTPRVESVQTDTGGVYTYAWREPSHVFELPPHLVEVSGLTYQAGRIVFNIDERGAVYYFSVADESVVDSCNFRPKGDFEGIEIVGDTVYVVRSKGVLHAVSLRDSRGCLDQSYVLPFPEGIDIEGLGYDAATHSLIIAEKGDKKQLTDRRVWSFSLKNRQFTERLRVTHQDFLGYLPQMIWAADRTEPDPDNEFRFAPSAIAVHPITGDFFILSSSGRRLLILRPNGRFHALIQLDKSLFLQPEGIAFDEAGNLLIASEGKIGKEPARLFVFKSQ